MKASSLYLIALILLSCSGNKQQLESQLQSLDLNRGEITLCGSGEDQFGTVSFSLSCSEKVRNDFNLATALLHSFEYPEAEKVFVKVIDQDPQCVMAYWGAAMCSFHPLWEPPNEHDLQKGSGLISIARSLIDDDSSKESAYIEAIAAIYDDWAKIDHGTRLQKYLQASQKIYERYPEDNEAAIFYALALRAAADPADKSFKNQKKAGEILNKLFLNQPNHPGIAHYIIHTYDYPELATLALPAARQYATIAAASAHAQHMPSHIFTRLGLWDESITSNTNSISAAQCYAEKTQLKGHWDEELHGLDYLIYAYLQKADDDKAREQFQYLKTITNVFPLNFKDAYSFAAIPTRYALERKDWKEAASLSLNPADFPWEKFYWEKGNLYLGRVLGAVHTQKLDDAKKDLDNLKSIYTVLNEVKNGYQANLVQIQIKISGGWIMLAEGKKSEALSLLTDAANMEDATEKHPVTPGEVIPARELLGDLYMELGEPANALIAYEQNLARHPNRFNGLYGAAHAAEKIGDTRKATQYYKQLLVVAVPGGKRPELQLAKTFLSKTGV